MIVILTESPHLFSIEGIKNSINKMLGKQRGPAGVLRSLTQGLRENSIDFKVNPLLSEIPNNSTVHVLSSFEALELGIRLKKEQKVSKLIAGPNITVLPTDRNKILLSSQIDVVLQPSDWTKDLYVFLCPELKDKIKVWAAGVEDFKIENKFLDKDTVLVYKKNCPTALYNYVVKTLETQGFKVKTLQYGNFQRNEYFQLLDTCKFMVYITESESQGLALHEAWMQNVPTLVWNQGFYKINESQNFKTDKVSAPYLTDQNGHFFSSQEDFNEKLEIFTKKITDFNPREDSLNKFTDSKSALAYMAQIM